MLGERVGEGSDEGPRAHQPSAGPLVPPLDEQPPASAHMPLSSEVTGPAAKALSKDSSKRRSRDLFPHLPGIKLPDAPRLGRIASGTKERAKSLFGAATKVDPTRNRDRQWAVLVAIVCVIPCALCVWYAVAIFFPPSARESVPALLWTPGLWVDSGDPNGTYPHVRPNPALYADGYGQITCLVVARISAFAMYAAMGNTFLTKCHGLMCALSRTMV